MVHNINNSFKDGVRQLRPTTIQIQLDLDLHICLFDWCTCRIFSNVCVFCCCCCCYVLCCAIVSTISWTVDL